MRSPAATFVVRVALATVVIATSTVSLAAQGDAMPRAVRGFRTEVAISQAPLTASAGRMARHLVACGPSTKFAEGDSAALMNGFVGPTPAKGTVRLVLIAHEGARLTCGDSAGRVAAASRGVRFSYDTSYIANRDLREAVLMRGSVAVTATRAERALAAHVTPWGVREPGLGMIILEFPFDSIAPDENGSFASYGIEAAYARDLVPDRFPLPEAMVERLWITALTESGRLSTLDAEAQRLFGALDAGELRGDARRHARIRVASAFVATGDEAGARLLLGQALRADPCLGLDSSVVPATQALFESLRRPPGRCETVPLRRVAVRSAILPGFGRPSESRVRPLVGGAVIAVIVGGGALGVSEHIAANSAYDKYQSVKYKITDPDTAGVRSLQYYYEAEAKRRGAHQKYLLATGIWLAAITEGVLGEYLYGRYLVRIQDSGAVPAPRIGIAPLLEPDRIGVRLTLPRRAEGAP